jgi:hypothetical protein
MMWRGYETTTTISTLEYQGILLHSATITAPVPEATAHTSAEPLKHAIPSGTFVTIRRAYYGSNSSIHKDL